MVSLGKIVGKDGPEGRVERAGDCDREGSGLGGLCPCAASVKRLSALQRETLVVE